MYSDKGALDNKSRKVIFNYISDHPGASFGNIKKVLDMKKSTLLYHLNYLERAGKIISKKTGRTRQYYCKDRPLSNVYSFTKPERPALTKTQQNLLELIRTRPGLSKNLLGQYTKLNGKNLLYNLKRLRELKLIWLVKNDGMIGYEYITGEKLREEAINRLIFKLISNEIDEQTFNRIMKKLETLDIDELIK